MNMETHNLTHTTHLKTESLAISGLVTLNNTLDGAKDGTDGENEGGVNGSSHTPIYS